MRPIAVAGALATVVLATACSGTASETGTTLTVSAASSLTDAFTEIGEKFMAVHPDTELRFNFAGSSTLAEQINAGAPVDVFAAASLATMQTAVDAGTVTEPTVFTANALAVAVPAGNPAGLTSLADLADDDVTVVVCAVPVPCGVEAQKLFRSNALDVTPVSLEPDVRAVLTKVIADEADAGIVYRTDVAAAGPAVEGILIADDINVVNEYPIAVTVDAPPEAQEFVDFVLGEQGQAILAIRGFTSP